MLTPATKWWDLAFAAQVRLGFSGLFSSLHIKITYIVYIRSNIAYIYNSDVWDKTPMS